MMIKGWHVQDFEFNPKHAYIYTYRHIYILKCNVIAMVVTIHLGFYFFFPI